MGLVMMLHHSILLLLLLLAITASGQITLTGSEEIAAASSAQYNGNPESDRSYTSTVTGDTARESSNTDVNIEASSANGSMTIDSASAESTTSNTASTSVILLQGSVSSGPSSTDTPASENDSSEQSANTQPCNGHPSFCSRKYSNITYVGAHNSPFVRDGNAAANQELSVTIQLQDGIRMLQFPTHWNESEQSFHMCHSSCDVLDGGTLESYLRTVTDWLSRHPYDVVTILMTNFDAYPPDRYIDPVTASGLIDYVYVAPKIPMDIQDWPTLEEMIFANTRAVVMLDYEANQEEIPWLHNEFAQMFETPFSPTDRDFPCTADRPPAEWPDALPREKRMYMANHNLNAAISFAGFDILVPNTPLLNETNAAADNIEGSAEQAVEDCLQKWDRPPNFLLVDFYNIGDSEGSVFQVAAEANNVPYDPSRCCGTPPENSAVARKGRVGTTASISLAVLLLFSVMEISSSS